MTFLVGWTVVAIHNFSHDIRMLGHRTLTIHRLTALTRLNGHRNLHRSYGHDGY